MKMPPIPELSYQVILHSWRRILLANCPHEAETVNSQVRPVTLCLQVGPCVSVQADCVECCSSGNGVVDPSVSWSDGSPFGVCCRQLPASLELICVHCCLYTLTLCVPTLSPHPPCSLWALQLNFDFDYSLYIDIDVTQHR